MSLRELTIRCTQLLMYSSITSLVKCSRGLQGELGACVSIKRMKDSDRIRGNSKTAARQQRTTTILSFIALNTIKIKLNGAKE